MAISLDAITLPSDLIWIDEYSHTPVRQSIATAVDGSLIVEAAAQVKGRPITLQGGDNAAWIDRATLEQLRAKQYQPGLVMTLIHNSSSYSVLFIHPGGIEARPVIDYSNPGNEDWYTLTLKLIEI
jgi:hypothetical protein